MSKVLQQEIKDLKVDVLLWEPKSPDLNCIEELWSIIDKELGENPIYSAKDLKQHLSEEWNNLLMHTIQGLIESMPQLFATYVKAREDHFLL